MAARANLQQQLLLTVALVYNSLPLNAGYVLCKHIVEQFENVNVAGGG